MPKAYWIARVDVHDPETYKTYVETAKPAFERYNAKFLARGGKTEVLEGAARARNVVIEFASLGGRACLLPFAGIHRRARIPQTRPARANSFLSKAFKARTHRRSVSCPPPMRGRWRRRATLPADVVILDLEDAVAPEDKAAGARPRPWPRPATFAPREVVVRINCAGTALA